MRRLSDRLSYANVVASVALFVALSGTSYAAVSLSRGSVGSREIRDSGVRSGDIRARAIRSRHLAAESVTLGKLRRSTRQALRGGTGPAGPQGPPGANAVTYRASVSFTGGRVRGNALASGTLGRGRYEVIFDRDTSQCTPVATLGNVRGNDPAEEPPAGRITAAAVGSTIVVRTFDAQGNPEPLAFNVIVAC